MSGSSIQGQLLEVSVTSCNRLTDTEWISRQDPYVSLEYGTTKYRTRTHTDGGTNPVFQEKFMFTLIEGLKVLKVAVWNSNTMKRHDFIGDGMIHLQTVISQGFDETSWPIVSHTGKNAGEVRLMMRYSQANKSETSHSTSAPECAAQSHAFYQSPSPCPAHPPAPAAYPYHPTQPAGYPPPPYAPPAYPPYGPPPPSAYRPYAPPPSAYPAYAPPPSAYPANAPPPSAYPAYAPPPSAYPPPYLYTDPSYYSTGPYRGAYPQ